jgi:transcriptional regulator with XRE-family HTH domain
MSDKGFDSAAFFAALEATVISRRRTWKQVSVETGVSASTLTRMTQGRGPDAASLAALSAWAGLNPSDFVRLPQPALRPEPIAQISALLRTDPRLDEQSAAALEAIVRAAYEKLKREQGESST